jgi:hypothetical protein
MSLTVLQLAVGVERPGAEAGFAEVIVALRPHRRAAGIGHHASRGKVVGENLVEAGVAAAGHAHGSAGGLVEAGKVGNPY